MSAEFPDLSHCHWSIPPSELCADEVDHNVKDWVSEFYRKQRRKKVLEIWLSFLCPTSVGRNWYDQQHGLQPGQCSEDRDFQDGRSPYVMNGVPISKEIDGCCINDPCLCRSDVIFYNGLAYDQKPYLAGRLRRRPGNVMYLEGKIIPPFNPGKSPQVLGPYRARDKYPVSMCSNCNRFGKGIHPCCTTSIYNDTIPPYHNTQNLGYTRMGLPYGETIGYFRFKPNKICDTGRVVERLGQCCTCEPGQYNPAQYPQDDCPPRPCCC